MERAELVNKYGIGLAKLGFRGFALILFGPEETYPLKKFDEIWSELIKACNLLRKIILENIGRTRG